MDPDTPSEPDDLAGLSIPRIAWLIALAAVALACVAMWVPTTSLYHGCLHHKSCYPTPAAPLGWGAAIFALGTAASVYVGRVPRHWLVGWSVTVAGLGTLVMIPLAWTRGWASDQISVWSRDLPLNNFEKFYQLVLGMLLTFLVLGVCNLLAAWLTSLVMRHRASSRWLPRLEDTRPRWQREVSLVRSALSGSPRQPLGSEEMQLVAELAYRMQHEETLAVPETLSSTAPQLLDLLSRDADALDVRGAVLSVLEHADASAARQAAPYRGA